MSNSPPPADPSEADNADGAGCMTRIVRQSWMTIDSAPKNGTEILVWREDAGTLLARWVAPAEFMTESELEDWSDEEAWEHDWFYADFIEGGRLEPAPTHWTHLPCMTNTV